MKLHHHQDFEGFFNAYSEELKDQIKFLKALDGHIISNNLPPVGKTKELFDIHENYLMWSTTARYEKQHNIKNTEYMGLDLKKEEFLDEMRNILKEEVARYFDQFAGFSK